LLVRQALPVFACALDREAFQLLQHRLALALTFLLCSLLSLFLSVLLQLFLGHPLFDKLNIVFLFALCRAGLLLLLVVRRAQEIIQCQAYCCCCCCRRHCAAIRRRRSCCAGASAILADRNGNKMTLRSRGGGQGG
jgi:hypothetical protein